MIILTLVGCKNKNDDSFKKMSQSEFLDAVLLLKNNYVKAKLNRPDGSLKRFLIKDDDKYYQFYDDGEGENSSKGEFIDDLCEFLCEDVPLPFFTELEYSEFYELSETQTFLINYIQNVNNYSLTTGGYYRFDLWVVDAYFSFIENNVVGMSFEEYLSYSRQTSNSDYTDAYFVMEFDNRKILNYRFYEHEQPGYSATFVYSK